MNLFLVVHDITSFRSITAHILWAHYGSSCTVGSLAEARLLQSYSVNLISLSESLPTKNKVSEASLIWSTESINDSRCSAKCLTSRWCSLTEHKLRPRSHRGSDQAPTYRLQGGHIWYGMQREGQKWNKYDSIWQNCKSPYVLQQKRNRAPTSLQDEKITKSPYI